MMKKRDWFWSISSSSYVLSSLFPSSSSRPSGMDSFTHNTVPTGMSFLNISDGSLDKSLSFGFHVHSWQEMDTHFVLVLTWYYKIIRYHFSATSRKRSLLSTLLRLIRTTFATLQQSVADVIDLVMMALLKTKSRGFGKLAITLLLLFGWRASIGLDLDFGWIVTNYREKKVGKIELSPATVFHLLSRQDSDCKLTPADCWMEKLIFLILYCQV